MFPNHPPPGCVHRLALLSLALTFVIASAASTSADDKEDNAAQAPYANGWQTGDNGNIGSSNFPSWFTALTGASTATIGSAPGIDIGGQSFIISRFSSANNARASRNWNLPTPDPISTFSFDLEVVASSGGFMSITTGIFDTAILSTGTVWAILDSATTPTGIPDSDPIRARYIIDADATYDVEIVNLATGAVFASTNRTTMSGTPLTSAATFTIGGDANTGVGSIAANNIRMDNGLIDYRDNAGEGVYGDGWDDSRHDSGNAGGLSRFEPWVLNLPAGSTATIGSAGLTDVNGASFQVTNTGGVTEAIRSFVPPTPSPATVIQCVAHMTAGTTTIRLRTQAGVEGVQIGSSGGNWAYFDGSGLLNTGIPISQPVAISAIADATTSYDMSIRSLSSGAHSYETGRTWSSALTGDQIGQFVFNPNNPATISFNSLAVDSAATIPVPVELSGFELE